ncbi:hypothetical protein COY32_03600 [candidate division WWE3 bacterium CG_4_10_14_0_2_um_filter_41_14]|uniref:Transcription regulator TrmB N-terminal domain-containing protein n=1 Tax=candidate division WWE3 bacterium CG_4_10_14_0_2_um_filter_41_14 TaxID=1975072 RepID=A0A2M7TIV8_UNCKA|nr:MAG: hypothetical protein COY32_03600 [candidate division WWE3 bacterium CG_4_10_14_0_2_um_filter_41_14]
MEILDDILSQAGLSDIEATTYSTLLSHGSMSILELSQKSNITRTNLYNILTSLEEKGLVEQDPHAKSAHYIPKPPREVKKLLELKEKHLFMAKNTFDLLIGNLQSQYNLISNKPTISYLEGIDGLAHVYQDILDTSKDILLFRSTHDDKRNDVDTLIQKQITQQVKRGIKARVIGPPEDDAKELYTKLDTIRLVEERFITNFPFELPAQILIYHSKVATVTIRDDIIVTLIDNPAIAETFTVLFNFVWEYATPEHNKLVESWNIKNA